MYEELNTRGVRNDGINPLFSGSVLNSLNYPDCNRFQIKRLYSLIYRGKDVSC